MIAAIRRLTVQPIRYVIDTSADPDHVGGNEKVSKAGRTLFQTSNPLGEGMTNGGAAAILSAEKVLTRMSAPTGQARRRFRRRRGRRKHSTRSGSTCSSTARASRSCMRSAAHTDGDSIVFFRRSDVVVAGDILDTTRFPVIDVAQGRQHPGRDRRAQPARRSRDSVRPVGVAGRRHLRDPRARPRLRSARRRRLPGHGDDRSRPRAGSDQERHDARADQGRRSDAGLQARATDPIPARGRRACSSKRCTRA